MLNTKALLPKHSAGFGKKSISYFKLLILSLFLYHGLYAMDGECLFKLQISIKESLTRALITSVQQFNYKCTLYYLSKGANPNSCCSPNGKTALIVACCSPAPFDSRVSHEDLVKLLLAFHADCLQRDTLGYCALDYAIMKNLLKVVQCMFRETPNIKNACLNAPVPPLHLAAFYGAHSSLRFLLEQGLPVDVYDISGRTPLHIAVTKAHVMVVNDLLNYNASVLLRTLEPRVHNENTEQLESDCTSFHLAATLTNQPEANIRRTKEMLLSYFFDGNMNIKQAKTFLCCLRKACPELYAIRKNVVIPYIISLKSDLIARLLASRKVEFRTLGTQACRYQLYLLQQALLQKNSLGLTAAEIEKKYLKDNAQLVFSRDFGKEYSQYIISLKPKDRCTIC